jgi:peptidoglycan/LPS O-acetylase OafA/YrhL
MQNRITQLDSIRGLAALSVILGHILMILPPLPFLVSYSPLRILWAGHEVVVLFFMLSGYVLSLPFIKNGKVNYPQFFIRRIFRIYVPFIVAILMSLLLKKVFFAGSNENIGWANNFWTHNLDVDLLLNHFFLITDFNTDAINPVVWSLVHELRISMVFPLMMIILKLKWTQSIILAFFISLVGILLSISGMNLSEGYLTSFAYSLHYSSMFVIGALLAINYEKIIKIFKVLTIKTKYLLLTVGLCLYTLQIGFTFFLSSKDILFFIRDWTTAVGAAIFIVISLGSAKASNILNKKYVEFFGKISYSLYLYHLPILFASLYLLEGFLPMWLILVIGVFITIMVSTISWKYIENLSVKFGRVLSKKVVREKINSKKVA